MHVCVKMEVYLHTVHTCMCTFCLPTLVVPFLYKSTMTELVSSGYLKSNTPRADRRQAAVVSCWDKGERESREKEGGSEWMRKEGGKVRMSNG